MHESLFALLVLLSAAVGAVALARYFRLPTMVAYLATGVVLGPHGFRILAESRNIEAAAEFGVVFLMFSIGLEFSLQRLKAMRRLVFAFGGTQLLVTAATASMVLVLAFEQDWRAGLAIGLAVAMSSTAIVARMLSERFELHTRSGRQTMGVLLFQDLAVVPSLILLAAIADPHGDPVRALAVGMAQAAAALILLIWVGHRLLRHLLDAVAARRSEELFVLATLWIVVALAYATGAAGLSLALGAFIGGMLISETVYRHQVEADIRPFRDILLGLFFVTIGMMLDVGYTVTHAHWLALALLTLVIGKGLIALLAARLAGTATDVSLRTAAQLAQGGEFGLVLLALAAELRLVGEDAFQLTLSAMLASMFLAPVLIDRAARLSDRLARGDWAHKAKAIHDIAVAGFGIEDHVLICGFGRTGRNIATFLTREHIPFLALDIDPAQVKAGAPAGGRIAFGSADRPEVLKAAGLSRARAVVIAYPEVNSSERVVRLVRDERRGIPIVVRAADESAIARLKAAGATEVIAEVLEGSLTIVVTTLAQMGVPVERATAQVMAARAERYGTHHSSLPEAPGDPQ